MPDSTHDQAALYVASTASPSEKGLLILRFIQSERVQARTSHQSNEHLRFAVPVYDASRGGVFRSVEWWDTDVSDHLANAAFVLCQIQYLMDLDDAAPAQSRPAPRIAVVEALEMMSA